MSTWATAGAAISTDINIVNANKGPLANHGFMRIPPPLELRRTWLAAYRLVIPVLICDEA